MSHCKENRIFLRISGVYCKENRIFFTYQASIVKKIPFSLHIVRDLHKKSTFLDIYDARTTVAKERLEQRYSYEKVAIEH